MSTSKHPKLYLGESYDAVNRRYINGMVSERDWRLFQLLWTWSVPRFGGAAGRKQDRMYQRCGAQALERRITRARAHLTRLSAQPVAGAACRYLAQVSADEGEAALRPALEAAVSALDNAPVAFGPLRDARLVGLGMD